MFKEEMQKSPSFSLPRCLDGIQAITQIAYTHRTHGCTLQNDVVTLLFYKRALKHDRIAVMQPREMKSIDTSLNDATAEERGNGVSLLIFIPR